MLCCPKRSIHNELFQVRMDSAPAMTIMTVLLPPLPLCAHFEDISRTAEIICLKAVASISEVLCYFSAFMKLFLLHWVIRQTISLY